MPVSSIQTWIQEYFVSIDTPINASIALFEQLDSLQVVSFILECNNKFQCFEDFSTLDLSQMTVVQVAEVIDQLSKEA